ncbi:hypothetical protein KL941_003997 [Ogataea angusta]|nr:hypothetical protein KL941_003997 [Ogataea angusta]
MTFSAKKVAIIGAGAGGLVTLNELLHTASDGSSTIDKEKERHALPANGAFSEITVFEQNSSIGGVWNYSNEKDEGFPSGVVEYYKPSEVRPTKTPPESLDSTSREVPIESKSLPGLRWNKSGIYDGLFTNIPGELMRFTSGPPSVATNDGVYAPFVTHDHVLRYLKNFTSVNGLEKYIRFRSSVEKVYKDPETGKWVLQVVERKDNADNWYQETFDAVVVAIGKFNIPHFPKVKGLREFAAKHKNVSHAKSYRNPSDFRNKKVLIVGSSISAVDILQYLIPVCKEVHVSANTLPGQELKNNKEAGKKWISDVLMDPALLIRLHPKIRQFLEDSIEFIDGQVESFDKIILATGYHTHYPFLSIPENEGKGYVNVSTDGEDATQHNIVMNLYLYTFSIGDSSLCHIGIPSTPLFFLICEVSAIAVAGVWSNAKALPSKEEQRQWVEDAFALQSAGTKRVTSDAATELYNKIHSLGPRGRYNFFKSNVIDDPEKAKIILKDLFYKIVKGKIEV